MINFKKYKFDINADDTTFRDELFDKRQELIKIAVSWSGNYMKNQIIYNKIWTYKEEPAFTVGLGKMGKEYYRKNKNVNDMRPTITNNEKLMGNVKGGFNDIFELMFLLREKKAVLMAFVVLFLRNALILDHKIIDGKYCYNPDAKLVQYICKRCPEYERVPMEVYIHFLDAIALNEDVKYWTRGQLNKSNGIGRENNMKTYIHLICCLLNKEPWSEFLYQIMWYGVAPLSNEAIATNFPELKIQYKLPITKRKRTVQSTSITKTIDQEPKF